MEWLAPIGFLAAVTVIAVLGLWLIRLRTNQAALARHSNAASAVFSIVGTLFTVLLAFIVIVVWEAQDKAAERAALEAGILGDLIRDAALFPEPERTQLQSELREYGRAVIDEEWPAMSRGESSRHVWDAIDRLFGSFSRVNPMTQRESNFHAEMLTRLNELADHRRLRLLSAGNKVPPLLWGVLLAGALITIAFSYFLGVEAHRAHSFMTGALAAMIALTLYLIYAIDQPFAGTVRVEPDAFRLALQKTGTSLP